ncbi:MAG: hypothetical protein KUG77_13115 [Nannocystaceae bacterium]|nr:hypothetical protein [Nannocystaceae bacterium]
MLEGWLRHLDEPDDPQLESLKVFCWLIPLQMATEYLCATLESWRALDATRFALGGSPLAHGFGVPLQTFFLVLSSAAIALIPLQLWSRGRRLGRLGALALALSIVVATFPRTGNHLYLVVVVVGLCVRLEFASDAMRDLLARSLRWVLIVVLFSSGLQKLAYGFYLDGQMLAYLGDRDGYSGLLSLLTPEGEAHRLATLPRVAGGGPFSSGAPLLLVASNLTYVAEMLLPLLLLYPKTRRLGVMAAFGLILVIEVFAREVFFGLWFTALLLLFVRPAVARGAFVAVVFVDVALVLVRLGILPEVLFT